MFVHKVPLGGYCKETREATGNIGSEVVKGYFDHDSKVQNICKLWNLAYFESEKRIAADRKTLPADILFWGGWGYELVDMAWEHV